MSAAIPGSDQTSDEEWDQARRRRDAMKRLAGQASIPLGVRTEVATELGVSTRYVYQLLRQYKESDGSVTAMLANPHSGGRGKSRVAPEVEELIAEILKRRYLTRQRRPVSAIYADVVVACNRSNLRPPGRATVERRIRRLDPVLVTRSREGTNAVRKLTSAGGRTPHAAGPLDVVEIDHTKINVLVVDRHDRKYLGRPTLTIAICRWSRCIVGMVVSFEPPSALLVGLCLAEVVTNKTKLLSNLGVDVDWPMTGLPNSIYVDNGSDFTSEAVQRGCEQHGITLAFRPPGEPHYGATVENFFGKFNHSIHQLPGTTFSSTAERGRYPSEKKAILTLEELNRWAVLAIARYHASIHRSIEMTPAAKWQRGIELYGPPSVVADSKAFLLDFLPIFRRKVGREGFSIDKIHYYANVLRPWIGSRNQKEKFLLRRDPRDISRIWVEDPINSELIEIPARDIALRPIPIWEYRERKKRAFALGMKSADPAQILHLTEQMESVVEAAQRKTRHTKRGNERKISFEGPRLSPNFKSAPEPLAGDIEHISEAEIW